jgi:AbrB family looped-hinge helix DNA binding protein
MKTVKLNKKGQLTLPVGIRKQLSLREGHLLTVTVEDRQIIARPVEAVRPDPSNLARLSELERLKATSAAMEAFLSDMGVSEDEVVATFEVMRRNALLKKAKPFNWEETLKKLPPLTAEEKAEGEAFIATLEEQRRKDRELDGERDRRLKELFPEDDS